MEQYKRKIVVPLISHYYFNVLFEVSTCNLFSSGRKLEHEPSIISCLYFILIPSLFALTQDTSLTETMS